MQREERLSGGDVSEVHRIGNSRDRVHRSGGAFTPAVDALLAHLAPRLPGVVPQPFPGDAQGRQVLEFLEGDPLDFPLPAWATREEQLIDLGRLVRRVHDAQEGFVAPPGARWAALPGTPGPPEIVCHTDLTPQNLLHRDRRPAALIDWDMAAPSTRVWELAGAARWWVPFEHPASAAQADFPPASFAALAARLEVLLGAYDHALVTPAAVLAMLPDRLRAGMALHRERAAAGEPGFVRMVAAGSLERIARDLDWLNGELVRHAQMGRQRICEFGFPGPLRERLVAAVLDGSKTATTALRAEWEVEGAELPTQGERETVIDSDGRPVATIEIVQVEIIRLADGDDRLAAAEGEEYRTASGWRAEHERFWNDAVIPAWPSGTPPTIDDDTEVVVQWFRLCDPRP